MFLFTLTDVRTAETQPLMKRPFEWHVLSPLYQDPRRAYHDVRHIHTLLRDILCLDVSEDQRRWLEAIAWLHDAYNDPLLGSPGNEQMSASLLDTSVGECFTDHGKELARATIALTAQHAITHENIAPLSALFLDIDISHLGASYTVFIRNSQLISKSTAIAGWPTMCWWRGYHRFFQSMLARQRLYYTEPYSHVEGAARANLQKGLEESAVLVAAPQMSILEYPTDE